LWGGRRLEGALNFFIDARRQFGYDSSEMEKCKAAPLKGGFYFQ
jgi:hypothetical protein